MTKLNFTTTIHSPVAKVRDTMLNHPTYEQWTRPFSEGSTYEGSRDQGADIQFIGPSGEGMLAKIAANRLHDYISIAHQGEMMINKATGKLETKMYDHAGFENYIFTTLSPEETKLDVELTAIPDDYADMFNDMRPKSLAVLQQLCES